MIDDKTLIINDAETTDDVVKAYEQAVAENKQQYIAISKAGKRFGLVDGKVVPFGENEFATNDKFVEEVAEKLDEQKEEVTTEEKNDEVAVEEKIKEVLAKPEIASACEKFAAFDVMEAKCAELETRNIELNDEIAKLNAQIDELSLKCDLPQVEVAHETTLDEVIDFLKAHHINSLVIGE